MVNTLYRGGPEVRLCGARRGRRVGWLGGGMREGQALLWVALMLPVFLAIVGLALDGGALFAARRQAQNVADAAARAGAQQIDIPRYRATGEVALDRPLARGVAREYVAGLGELEATIGASEREVTVMVRRDVPLSFLRLVGLSSVSIGATAVAEPFYGIGSATR